MEFQNKTPHKITLIHNNGTKTVFDRDGKPIRLKPKVEKIGDWKDKKKEIRVPITRTLFGKAKNLPPNKTNIVLIVSRLVLDQVDREDMVTPEDIVRDDDSNIIGCKSFAIK